MAAVGLIASIPLAVLKVGVWSNSARGAFPALKDMQQREADVLRPLLERMSPFQVWPCFMRSSKNPDVISYSSYENAGFFLFVWPAMSLQRQ
jgi:hypothetical protein